jgi:hypothetical protein
LSQLGVEKKPTFLFQGLRQASNACSLVLRGIHTYIHTYGIDFLKVTRNYSELLMYLSLKLDITFSNLIGILLKVCNQTCML